MGMLCAGELSDTVFAQLVGNPFICKPQRTWGLQILLEHWNGNEVTRKERTKHRRKSQEFRANGHQGYPLNNSCHKQLVYQATI